MGPLPFDELAEKFRELQQGAGEHLGKLRQAAETLAANFDPKKRERKQREAAAESSSAKPGSYSHRRGRVEREMKVHPIAAVSHTDRRQTGKVIARQQLVQEGVRGNRLQSVKSAALVIEKEEPVAEVSVQPWWSCLSLCKPQKSTEQLCLARGIEPDRSMA